MSRREADGPESLPMALAYRVEQSCERFEAEWRSGGRPDLPAYLDGVYGPERAALTRELVAIDAHWRRRAGERPGIGHYLAALPADADAVRVAFDSLDPADTDHSVPRSGPPSGSDATGTGETSVIRRIRPGGAGAAIERVSVEEPDKSLTVVPDYEILGVLGRGGMGVVYKARRRGLTRIVALKMILSGAHAGAGRGRARFRWEGEAVARLQHPNIVQIHDIGEHAGFAYLTFRILWRRDSGGPARVGGDAPARSRPDSRGAGASGARRPPGRPDPPRPQAVQCADLG